MAYFSFTPLPFYATSRIQWNRAGMVDMSIDAPSLQEAVNNGLEGWDTLIVRDCLYRTKLSSQSSHANQMLYVSGNVCIQIVCLCAGDSQTRG